MHIKAIDYQILYARVVLSAKNHNIDIQLMPDNEERFNQQSGARGQRYCYYICPRCNLEKRASYNNLSYGKGIICKACALSDSIKLIYIQPSTYIDLIRDINNVFDALEIVLKLHSNNEQYFNSQNTNPVNRLCLLICPYCTNETVTKYKFLKNGKVRCMVCKSNKISASRSKEYNTIIDIINTKICTNGMELTYQDDNYEKFIAQTDKMPTFRFCYHFCVGCNKPKRTPFNRLINGIGYFCQACGRSFTEKIYSYLIVDIIHILCKDYNVPLPTILEGSSKFKMYINNTLYIPDIYIQSDNVAIIEINGMQHYQPVKSWGGQSRFEKQQHRDATLRTYCKDSNILYYEIDCRDSRRSTPLTKHVEIINCNEFTTLLAKILGIYKQDIQFAINNYMLPQNIQDII